MYFLLCIFLRFSNSETYWTENIPLPFDTNTHTHTHTKLHSWHFLLKLFIFHIFNNQFSNELCQFFIIFILFFGETYPHICFSSFFENRKRVFISSRPTNFKFSLLKNSTPKNLRSEYYVSSSLWQK